MASVILAPAETAVLFRRQCPVMRVPRPVVFTEALRLLGAEDHGCFVLDPRGLRDDQFTTLCEAIRSTRMSVLIYTPPEGVERATEIVTPFVIEMVIVGVEREREVLEALLVAEGPTVLAKVRFRLMAAASGLAPELRRAIHALFAWGPIPRTVNDFAALTGKSPSTLNRGLAKAGLRSVEALLAAANVCRMHRWLAASPDTIEALAGRHSIVDAGALGDQYREFAGVSPRRAVRSLTRREIAGRIVARLTERSGGASRRRRTGGHIDPPTHPRQSRLTTAERAWNLIFLRGLRLSGVGLDGNVERSKSANDVG